MLQNIFGFLIVWYNLPYTVFLGLGLGIAALQLFGLSHDSDADLDADVDADLDLDADADADADMDADHALDHDTAPGAASGFSWLAFIGFGKTPVMVVLLILFFSIGLLGWFLNGVIFGIFGFFPSLLILFSGLASLAASVFVTSRATRFIGRVLPPISTTATRAQAMVGMNGKVISPLVDNHYGLIHLRDEGGTLVSLFAITEDDTPIPRGEMVMLLSYNTEKRRYLVTRR
jgi:membrane protein implicated in regulation of membrane protease activity